MIRSNGAGDGGGLYLYDSVGGAYDLTDTLVASNSADYGGGLYVLEATKVSCTGAVGARYGFVGNTAVFDGGGVGPSRCADGRACCPPSGVPMRRPTVLLSLLLPLAACDPAKDWVPTPAEQDLYERIMDYRAAEGLPSIPYSVSLSIVARTHSTDLLLHAPHESGSDCNGHSWSGNGDWTSCCYTPDHAAAQCMWDKPRELTDYPGNGYEISAFGQADGAAALEGWKGSPGHNSVILNLGIWEDRSWGAVGVGIDGAFYNVWFGEPADPRN